MRETSELRRNLQALAEKANVMAAEIRKGHEMEKKRVDEAHANMDRGLTKLRGDLGAHAQNHTKNHDDHADQIQGLRDLSKQETNARKKDITAISAVLDK